MISAIFDDHYEAFPTWREAGLSGLTCIHVDAHLDVMSDGFSADSLQAIAKAETSEELLAFRSNPRLPWGGFHCGNYLYPALIDGTVETLIWVVPPHVIKGETFVDGVRQETQKWLDLSFQEYSSLVSEEGRVAGTLRGRRYIVCTADNMPPLTPEQKQNLALDIDVDYFIRSDTDQVWQTPQELYRLLGCPEPRALTVAYSVDGGYTPVKDRYLGEVVREVFTERCASKWGAETDEILRIDSLPDAEERTEALAKLLKTAPEWLKPALFTRLGEEEKAAKIEPEYRVKPANIVARHMMKKENQEGLDLLKDVSRETPEVLYLRAYLQMGAEDLVEAKRNFSKLLEHPQLREVERSRVLFLKAGVCLRLGETRDALKLTQEAQKLEPESPQLSYLQAQAYRAQGDGKKAAKAIRKAMRLAKGHVSSLEMMVEAAQIYDSLGQSALARSTRKELKTVDVTGRCAIQTMLDEAKL